MQELPAAVVENIRNKETVIFVGSGFSIDAGFPSAAAIASLLVDKLRADGRSVDWSTQSQLDKVAEQFQGTYGRPRLVSEVEDLLRTSPQDVISASHRLLASLVKHGFVKTIVTTNYDTLIEDACALLGVPIRVISDDSQLFWAAGDAPVLYKIHGDFSHPELLVLTPFDFQQWVNRPEIADIVTTLKDVCARKALLFFGYSLSDFNILSLLIKSSASTPGAPQHKRFAAVHSDGDLSDAVERLKQYDVEAFRSLDNEDMLRSILLRLPVKLRVRHLVFNYPSWYPDEQARYGGIETFIDYLTDKSRDIEHTTLSGIEGELLTVVPQQIAYSTYPAYPASFFFFRGAAKTALQSVLNASRADVAGAPDVVHVHFLPFAPMSEEAGLATLCTSHSLLSVDLAYTKGLFDGQASPGAQKEVEATYTEERAAAAGARFVTVISAAHEEEVRQIGARSIRRLDAPFDPKQYTVEDDPSSARGRIALANKFTITYVGRPDRRKGIELLIGACEKLAASKHRFQLLFVGYGFKQSRGRLEFGSGRYWFDTARLEKAGVHIELRSATDSERAGVYYSASDIVVVPSLYEPMGYVVLEAMSCARPVVAARVGGIAETIVDGSNGLLFEPGDADELAEKLEGLYKDRDGRNRLGQQARKDMEARRPVQDIVNDWQELYRQTAFAFGESLYPSPELLQSIRTKCDGARANIGSSIDVGKAALLGCRLAKDVIAELGEAWSLPRGVPVDRALFRAIALELQHALRRGGVVVPFTVATLADVMCDLALAELNRDPDRPSVALRAEDTKKRLRVSWFEEAIGQSRSN